MRLNSSASWTPLPRLRVPYPPYRYIFFIYYLSLGGSGLCVGITLFKLCYACSVPCVLELIIYVNTTQYNIMCQAFMLLPLLYVYNVFVGCIGSGYCVGEVNVYFCSVIAVVHP